MSTEQFISALLPIILTILSGIGVLVGYWVKILAAKAKSQLNLLELEIDKQFVRSVIEQAEDFISTAVIETNQVLVDALKEKNEDGKLSAEEVKLAFNTTLSKVYDLMDKDMLESLDMVVADTRKWITSKIEYYINMNK